MLKSNSFQILSQSKLFIVRRFFRIQ